MVLGVGVDAAGFDWSFRMHVEQLPLALVGALRRQVHRQRWWCSRRSKQSCSATGPRLSGMIPTRNEVEVVWFHI